MIILMCLMGMVHFCVLCMQLVIYYLADFVHIWYNGWVWSEHVHIIPIFTVLLLKKNMGKWWFYHLMLNMFYFQQYKLVYISCGHIKDSSFRMCVPKCPTKSLSFAGLWFLTVWTKKKLCMLTFCILLNTCFLEMWLVKEENLLKVL
jgi:hypothetical protein